MQEIKRVVIKKMSTDWFAPIPNIASIQGLEQKIQRLEDKDEIFESNDSLWIACLGFACVDTPHHPKVQRDDPAGNNVADQ